MADSPAMTASEGTTPDAAAAVDSSANTEGSGDEQAPDYSAQRAAVQMAQEQAAIQAELEASRRARGHLAEHARRLAAVESRLESAGQPSSGSGISADQWNGLIDGLRDVLPDGVADRLRINSDAEASKARVAALESEIEKLKNPQAPTTPDAPEEPAELVRIRTGWEAAFNQVSGYARARGLVDTEVPGEPEWKTAFDAQPGDPAAGMEAVMKLVDERVAAKSRRAERTDAASGGPTKATPRKGGLTREMMKTMTPDELRKYPREERNAALMAP